MVLKAGDRVVVESEKVGVPPRRGQVLAVYGVMLTVHWDDLDSPDDGHESTF